MKAALGAMHPRQRLRVEQLRTQFARSSFAPLPYLTALLGALLAPALILGAAVAGIVWLGRHSRYAGLALCFFMTIGALSAIVEAIQVFVLRRTYPAYESGWNGVLLVEYFTVALFLSALAILYFNFY
jgi:hypothetical protein